PDFADALNYLGFMWADRGENLDKAREYIEKAVKVEPKNAAFLDSLGWVLHKLNQNDSALQYLLQAVALSDEPDPTLFDHLGDVYSALKRNEKAREAWKKSLTLEPSAEIEKKLQVNSSSL
ncbi:MAG: tetratricopeptide repeat protein, partial [Verrucomicrobiota bacterium]